ncbi:MAG TPA: phosphoribosylanthranilate isomerase [Terriglobales bacterium]|nr:phosphoribosylanthranilate isomerase [Terriglobales bacterium]
MTWVKICGMTNLEDALVAVEAGADAVGFVFYEKSPRFVSVETAREIVERLPDDVEKVGVFAGDSIEHAVEIGSYARFDALQVYLLTYRKPEEEGSLQAQAMSSGLRTYLALPISIFLDEGSRNIAGFASKRPPGVLDALFLDSGNAEQPGGTGQRFDWSESSSVVRELSVYQKVVVAGGLAPQNVGDAIAALKPWGVDVSSGVEVRPGKKDPDKVRAFVRAVREMDRKAN